MPLSQRIEDYALISNCAAGALVGRNGSLDWLCLPRFDSSACFAALLGTRDHGRWIIEPAGEAIRCARPYRENAIILETRMEAPGGIVTLIDFMPPRVRNSAVVRIVRGDRGRVKMSTELVMRFDYGRTVPWVSRLAD